MFKTSKLGFKKIHKTVCFEKKFQDLKPLAGQSARTPLLLLLPFVEPVISLNFAISKTIYRSET